MKHALKIVMEGEKVPVDGDIAVEKTLHAQTGAANENANFVSQKALDLKIGYAETKFAQSMVKIKQAVLMIVQPNHVVEMEYAMLVKTVKRALKIVEVKSINGSTFGGIVVGDRPPALTGVAREVAFSVLDQHHARKPCFSNKYLNKNTNGK